MKRKDPRERLRRLTPDTRPQWGVMSAHQMVCHLSDALRLVLKGDRIRLRSTRARRFIMRIVALHGPLPFPKGFRTMAELDQARGGTRPVVFDADVAQLIDLIDRFEALGDKLNGKEHPLFGALSTAEWRTWAHRHNDHHLRQFGL